MAGSWEDKKKSRKNIGLIISLCILVTVAGFFVFNNFIASDQSSDTVDSVTVEDTIKIEQEEETSEWVEQEDKEDTLQQVADVEEPVEPAAPEKKPEKEVKTKKKPVETSLHSLDLPTVKCVLADKKGLFVQVSLKVYFKDKKLENEILFKRDNIKVVVKKVMLTKSLSEVVADALRTELIKEINTILEKGKIEDIEFIDFRPVENI